MNPIQSAHSFGANANEIATTRAVAEAAATTALHSPRNTCQKAPTPGPVLVTTWTAQAEGCGRATTTSAARIHCMFPSSAYPRNVPTMGIGTPITGSNPTATRGSDQRPAQYQKHPKINRFQRMSKAAHPSGCTNVLSCATGGG